MYPETPSALINFGSPSDKPRAKPGCVWTRTLTASKGQSAISATNSDEADPAR